MGPEPLFVVYVPRPAGAERQPERLPLLALVDAGRGRLRDCPRLLAFLLGVDERTVRRQRKSLVDDGLVARAEGHLKVSRTYDNNASTQAGGGPVVPVVDVLPVSLFGAPGVRPSLLRAAAVVFGEACRVRDFAPGRDELAARARVGERAIADARAWLVHAGQVEVKPRPITRQDGRGAKWVHACRRRSIGPLVVGLHGLPGGHGDTAVEHQERTPGHGSVDMATPPKRTPRHLPHSSPSESTPHSAQARADGPDPSSNRDGRAGDVQRARGILEHLDTRRRAKAKTERDADARARARELVLDVGTQARLQTMRPQAAAAEVLAAVGYLDHLPGTSTRRGASKLGPNRERDAARIAARLGAETVVQLLRVVADLLLDVKVRSIGSILRNNRLGKLLAGHAGDAVSQARRTCTIEDLRKQLGGPGAAVAAGDLDARPARAVVPVVPSRPADDSDGFAQAPPPRAQALEVQTSARGRHAAAQVGERQVPSQNEVDRRTWGRIIGAALAGDWPRLGRWIADAGVTDLQIVADRSGVPAETITAALGDSWRVAASTTNRREVAS